MKKNKTYMDQLMQDKNFKEKFDEEYMFQLSNAEYENLIFQNGIYH